MNMIRKASRQRITKLQNATGNTEVRSSIDGVIQKIDTSQLTTDDGDSLDSAVDYSMLSGDDSSHAFITILSTSAYRIKGTVNEMNVGNIIEGSPGDHPGPVWMKMRSGGELWVLWTETAPIRKTAVPCITVW